MPVFSVFDVSLFSVVVFKSSLCDTFVQWNHCDMSFIGYLEIHVPPYTVLYGHEYHR